MRPVAELDYYELLEVGRDAEPEEIERAHRLARSTYADGSLATYSVFDDGENQAMLERIDRAYQELADPESRRHYDASLRGEDEDASADLEIALALETARRPPTVAMVATLDPLDEDSEAAFDGARLRRSRLQLGIDLDQIAQVTKISPSYLQFIEDERFEALPAPVYVRGFVSAYARCIGLDPSRVAPSYMERFQAEQHQPDRHVGRRR